MLAPSKEHDEKWSENGSHRMMSNGKKKKSHRCWSRSPNINGRGDGYFPFCVRPTLRTAYEMRLPKSHNGSAD